MRFRTLQSDALELFHCNLQLSLLGCDPLHGIQLSRHLLRHRHLGSTGVEGDVFLLLLGSTGSLHQGLSGLLDCCTCVLQKEDRTHIPAQVHNRLSVCTHSTEGPPALCMRR